MSFIYLYIIYKSPSICAHVCDTVYIASSSEAPSPIRALHFGPAKGELEPELVPDPEVLPSDFTLGNDPFMLLMDGLPILSYQTW